MSLLMYLLQYILSKVIISLKDPFFILFEILNFHRQYICLQLYIRNETKHT